MNIRCISHIMVTQLPSARSFSTNLGPFILKNGNNYSLTNSTFINVLIFDRMTIFKYLFHFRGKRENCGTSEEYRFFIFQICIFMNVNEKISLVKCHNYSTIKYCNYYS